MYRCSFWMKHYGCKTPKRTRLWSWSWGVSIFHKGKLQGKNRKATIKTALVYLDSQGVRRYKGTRALKSTQPLFCNKLLELFLYFQPIMNNTTVWEIVGKTPWWFVPPVLPVNAPARSGYTLQLLQQQYLELGVSCGRLPGIFQRIQRWEVIEI